MRAALAIADRQRRMLYEIRPDLLPQGMLTDIEVALWGMHFSEQSERRKQRERRRG